MKQNVVLFFRDPMWYEQAGRQSSRFTRFQREVERDDQGPLVLIAPKTVRRYRVKRSLAVERSETQGLEVRFRQVALQSRASINQQRSDANV